MAKKSIHHPARYYGEDHEVYRRRRRLSDQLIRQYLSKKTGGRTIWNSKSLVKTSGGAFLQMRQGTYIRAKHGELE